MTLGIVGTALGHRSAPPGTARHHAAPSSTRPRHHSSPPVTTQHSTQADHPANTVNTAANTQTGHSLAPLCTPPLTGGTDSTNKDQHVDGEISAWRLSNGVGQGRQLASRYVYVGIYHDKVGVYMKSLAVICVGILPKTGRTGLQL